ncbi:hypothetical protein [Streptomyces sp. MI02-7b]|uniref:hypothetical protein n=1 Tax=Streptomyces sp. MI02-7b TaxID=462941 RepID=UPI0029B0ED8F|nr:hypothetical protein [Streptomyces sp. MI02-7b]MDX3075199.1 hypothetical protein [Streptomyces sp. MI02-7b]
MAYTVLYIAFGVVALWLLGEVLLQYKARLRWRLLAFAGFMGVVLGVYLPSVVVIVLGALAFGTGQTFVTLSYRRGFVEGWALKAPKGDDLDDDDAADSDDDPAEPEPASRRAGGRRGRGGRGEAAEGYGAESVTQGPAEEHNSGVPEAAGVGQSYDAYAGARGAGAPEAHGMDSTQVYQPMPMHEDSGEYPTFDGQQPGYTPDPYTSGGYEGYGTTGYGDWNSGAQQQPAAAAYDAYGQPQQTGGWETQQAYGTYGGYQDPYQQGQQGQQGAGAPQQQGYGYDTPAGGVWVPQQGGEQQPYIPQQQNSYDQQQQQQPHEQQQGQGQGQYDPYDPYRYN